MALSFGVASAVLRIFGIPNMGLVSLLLSIVIAVLALIGYGSLQGAALAWMLRQPESPVQSLQRVIALWLLAWLALLMSAVVGCGVIRSGMSYGIADTFTEKGAYNFYTFGLWNTIVGGLVFLSGLVLWLVLMRTAAKARRRVQHSYSK